MDFAALLNVITSIRGATFASMDATTFHGNAVKKNATGMNVILFNSERAGYEAMVRRRLLEMGRDPHNFVVGDLPWGRRLYGPLIAGNGGKGRYLQSIILDPGVSEYFLRSVRGFDVQCREEDLPSLVKRRLNQGLPLDKQVEVRTFNVDHITRIKLMGTELQEQSQEFAIGG